MKKINYVLNENNQIVSYSLIPFDESKPYIEVEDVSKIKLGYSKVIDGEFYSNEGIYILVKQLRKELKEIQLWLSKNDWKVNKIVVGEWTTDDYRWKEYIKERQEKRNRNDYLIFKLKENGYEQ